MVVFDQATKLAHCVTWVHLDQHADVESAYRAGRAALRSLTARLSAPQQQLPPGRVRACPRMMWPPCTLGAMVQGLCITARAGGKPYYASMALRRG